MLLFISDVVRNHKEAEKQTPNEVGRKLMQIPHIGLLSINVNKPIRIFLIVLKTRAFRSVQISKLNLALKSAVQSVPIKHA